MPIITDIYETRGVCHISCEGREAFKLDKKTFTKLKLREGDNIDVEQTIEKAAEAQLDIAYESALNMLDRSAKTADQIKSALLRRGFLEYAADMCVVRLIKAKIIDDAEYAKRLVQTRSSKPVSKRALRQKLLSKGVNADDADAALEEITDEEQQNALKLLAEKLYGRYGELEPREGRQKLSMALARRGFGWDEIKTAVDKLYDGGDFE